MAPPAGQRSINAFFKAPAIATSVFRKPARADPPETEEVETESVPDRADVVAEEASRGGADWHLGGERRPVATYGRRRRGEARRAGAAPSKDDAGQADDAPSTSGARSDPVDAKRARTEVATTLRDGSSRANSRAAAPGMKQLFLDLGQKNFGHRKCPECGLLYAVGEPEDERTHAKFHAEATGRVLSGGSAGGSSQSPGCVGVPCPKTWRDAAAWTCEHDPSGRFVAHIRPDDHRARWGKATELAKFVGDELGAPNGWVLGEDAETRGTAAFAYVLRDRIVGAVFAEPVRRAYRTIPDDGGETGGESLPGESPPGESPPGESPGSRTAAHYGGKVLRRRAAPTRAVMGIRAAWVHPAHRRRGIATTLLRVARERLVPGYACDEKEVAWTQPTEDGASLAAATCGLGDGTFLVY